MGTKVGHAAADQMDALRAGKSLDEVKAIMDAALAEAAWD